MALPAEFAQHVKSMADTVCIVGETVTLKRSGANYLGLCPFCQEKTPTFSVHATKQFYYCFGCGAKGDVFRFVMEIEGVAFPEAMRHVAQRVGLPAASPGSDLAVTAGFRSAPPGCNGLWTNIKSGPTTGGRSVRGELWSIR